MEQRDITAIDVREVAIALRTLYTGTGFAFVPFDGPPRLRIRYADPDKTEWREVVTIVPAPDATRESLQAAALRTVEATRQRWKDEARKRFWQLARRGLMVSDDMPEQLS